MSGFSLRYLFAAFAVAAVGGLGGCNSSLDDTRYPEDLRYPARTDVLVVADLKGMPPDPNPPGMLDKAIEAALAKENQTLLEPKEVAPEQRRELRLALAEIFGTPRFPSVEPIDPTHKRAPENGTENAALHRRLLQENLGAYGLTDADLVAMKLDERTLYAGSAEYRRHCLHCHGVSGDGRGPTGPWVNPHPRDYRSGYFKFVSSTADGRARRADILRTLRQGIDGTSMPAFGLLSDTDLEALTSYVIHLSIRGEVEFQVLKDLLERKGEASALEGGSVRTHAYANAAIFLARWSNLSKADPLKPPAYPYEGADEETLRAAVGRGHQLFLGKGGCMACHSDYGRQVPYRYDKWGTLVRPRNLVEGNYRGGRRPLDLYWRVAGGIFPSGMSKASLSEAEYWDLIQFVQALPYPAMLPPDVREKVYGATEAKPAAAKPH